PFAKEKHEFLGTLTPLAFESFDFSPYDLVISVTSEAAKGIITKPGTFHVSYVLTPTRYLWSGYDIYFPKGSLLRDISAPAVSYLKKWDRIAAQRPDVMIAISGAVKKRISRYYGRDSEVIYPPVDTERFKMKAARKENFFLFVGRLVPYKRVDLAVKAFNKLGLPLVIIGKGSQEKRLKAMAKENIKFIPELTDAKLADYYRKCTALVLPQEEDFGIVALEAQAAGTPVIAYKAGGALDTVIAGTTGIFFDKQSVGSLVRAVKKIKRLKFNSQDLVKNAERFSKENFKKNFTNLLAKHGRF
ncbi:MAG: glycosyltransferase, partial [Patescibacteria group bacterium]